MNQHNILLKNDLAAIQTMVQEIKEFGQAHALSLRSIFDINLVLEEIITNIIFYGYEDQLEHCIMVNISWDDPSLLLTVSDDGKAFNPLERVAPDLSIPLEERVEGGLGIYFVKQRMDEVVYKWEEGRNVLTMRKDYAKGVI